MDEPFWEWSHSPHRAVNCHECHQQPLSQSIYQAWLYLIKRPDAVVHHPDLNHEVCARCHLSQDPQWKLIGETAGHKVHFEKAGIECLNCHRKGVHQMVRPVDSCLQCHEEKTLGLESKMSFVHCLNCHNYLAKGTDLAPTRDTCLGCHKGLRPEVSFPENAPMSSFDCQTCHQPHGQLRPDREVCLSCHVGLEKTHQHLEKETSCVTCHTPHRWKLNLERR